MSEFSSPGRPFEQVEEVLRAELAHGDAILASARPVLAHLVTSGDQELFSDEVIARIRSMAGDCARQLLLACGEAEGEGPRDRLVAGHNEELTAAILSEPTFLSHAHALTFEALLAEKLLQRSGIDPVLSPLIQETAAAPDEALAACAMHVLAAQARFVQQQRRMELPLTELPADLYHAVLLTLRNCAGLEPDGVARAEARLRAVYDEGKGRVGKITRLIMALDRKAQRALSLDHAGLAIFATALAMASSQDRKLAVLALGENQLARLSLALRAAGLSQAEVERQFLFLHPDITLPPGFETLSSQRAAEILSRSQDVGEG